MRKLLYKNNESAISSNIGSIIYLIDSHCSNRIQINTIEEKRSHEFDWRTIESFISKKKKEGWIDSDTNNSIRLDPILDCVEMNNDDYGILAKKYLPTFNKYVNILFPNGDSKNPEEDLKTFRLLFCKFVNNMEKMKERIISEIYKYAKSEYEQDNYIDCFQEEDKELAKKSLENKYDTFENLVFLEHIIIEEKCEYHDDKIIFCFNSHWDEEHGVAISFVNSEFCEIGQQGSV